ncbi:MAG: hypothetical protein HC869_00400 [Rhodospirillales bacterium]|nr:hypothetical protein [Rhodospirillales bacterium]
MIIQDETFTGSPDAVPPLAKKAAGVVELFPERAASPSRFKALEVINSELASSDLVFSTTGKSSRELYCINDSPANLYVVGSMGLASSIALGLSLNWKDRILIIDGDGSALMHMGSFAAIGTYGRGNLTHIILDNGYHDSTGGQPTVSTNVSFAKVGIACGYAYGAEVSTLEDLAVALRNCRDHDGPQVLHVHVRPGSISPLPRPKLSPIENLSRFRQHLATWQH